MDKKKIIIISLGVLVAALAIGLALMWNNLKESEKQHEEIQELIALEQEEMLNDLQAAQMEYDELKKKILSNDSLLVKLEQEQLRTQQLYEELQSTKATNAAEIKRLKKELTQIASISNPAPEPGATEEASTLAYAIDANPVKIPQIIYANHCHFTTFTPDSRRASLLLPIAMI